VEIQSAAEHGLLRNQRFLALWAAQILSMTAANALTSALIVLVAEITRSNTSSSFLILLAVIPAVLFGVFAGVFVDRSDRRLVLIVTNALRAAAVAVFLIVGLELTTAYIVNFLVAGVTVFFVPAEASTIPNIVRKRDLLVANSLFTFTFNGAFLLGFIIFAPLVIAFAGFPTLFALIVAMFGAAAGGGLEGLPYFIGLVVVTAFVFGLAYAFIAVPSMTLIQEELPDLIRGRVFGVLNVLVSVFSLVPIVIVGPVADIWGVAPVFLGAAIFVSVVWIGGRDVRKHSARAPAAT